MRRRIRICSAAVLAAWFAVGAARIALAGRAAQTDAPPATPSTIVFPPRLAAGEVATLAVLTRVGKLAPFAAVDLSDGKRVITDESGRAQFTVPAEEGVLLARLPETDVFSGGAILKPQPALSVQIQQLPAFVSLRSEFTMRGTGFHGVADENRLTIAGQPALVLAASAFSLVVLPSPKTPLGSAQAAIVVKGLAETAGVSVVGFEFDSNGREIAAGRKSKLLVRAIGTDQSLDIVVRNLSPDILHFATDDIEHLTTRGGKDNTADFEVEGIASGDFSFAVKIAPGEGVSPDVEVARQFLAAALTRAPASQKHRLDELSKRLVNHPWDAVRPTHELVKMFPSLPSGEYGACVRRAWEALAGAY